MDRAHRTFNRNASWDLPTRPLAHAKGGTWLSLPAQPFWRLMLGILLFGSFVAGSVILTGGSDLMRELPVTLHSSIGASYNPDSIAAVMQPVKVNLVNEVLSDQPGENGGAPVVQLTTVMNNLQTPVPSITPQRTNAAQATLTPAGSSSPTPGNPQVTDTAARTPTPLIEATATPTQEMAQTATVQPSPTRRPSKVPQATATELAPDPVTSTPTLFVKPSEEPTAAATSVVPTATEQVLPTNTQPAPTATVNVPPTATSQPPTATPLPTRQPTLTPTTHAYPPPNPTTPATPTTPAYP